MFRSGDIGRTSVSTQARLPSSEDVSVAWDKLEQSTLAAAPRDRKAFEWALTQQEFVASARTFRPTRR